MDWKNGNWYTSLGFLISPDQGDDANCNAKVNQRTVELDSSGTKGEASKEKTSGSLNSQDDQIAQSTANDGTLLQSQVLQKEQISTSSPSLTPSAPNTKEFETLTDDIPSEGTCGYVSISQCGDQLSGNPFNGKSTRRKRQKTSEHDISVSDVQIVQGKLTELGWRRRASYSRLKIEEMAKRKTRKAAISREEEGEDWCKKGAQVEVCLEDEGFRGSWYSATILHTVSKKTNKIFLEFHTLVCEDDETKPLRQFVNVILARPIPPRESTRSFQLSEEVDAFHSDGWWEGIVTEVLDDSRYSVFFRCSREQIQFTESQLRLHREWVYGNWVPSFPDPPHHQLPNQDQDQDQDQEHPTSTPIPPSQS